MEMNKKTPARMAATAAVLTAVLLIFCGCAATSGIKEDSGSPARWSYTGSTGPAYWYKLDPSYAAAKHGKSQSPVNIITSAISPDASGMPEIAYKKTRFKAENNGHTVEFIPETGDNYIILDGGRYTLSQFHFHAPSEHTINGGLFPMEMHLVHNNDRGDIAVIGFFITEGTENGTLKEAFEELPREAAHEEAGTPETEIDLAGLFAGCTGAYRYTGSLTTPPCTEGVKWIVAAGPAEMSAAQINSFKEIYSGNARPVQNLNGRTVYFASDGNGKND
jgi:carbonic anhydrase